MSQGYLLRKDDFPSGIQTPADVEKLASLLNPYLSSLNALIASGVTLSDNVSAEVQVGVFAHGVPQQFTLKRLPGAKGCVVLGCDSALVRAAPLMQAVLDPRPNALPRVSVTVWFDDPGVTRATVALLLTPEGRLCTTVPSVPQAWLPFPYAGNWSDFGAGNMAAGYFRDSLGLVHLRGLTKYALAGAGAIIIGTLPIGYRPTASAAFCVANWQGTDWIPGTLFINSSGVVQVRTWTNGGAGTSGVNLDGITFDTR
jgi:hypothetical protein